MSATALAAAALFGLWFAASIGFALPVRALRRRLQRVNQCRLLCAWTMFSAPPGAFSWYAIEYRAAGDTVGAWTRWTPWPVWRPFGWILDPRRPRAEALQRVAREIDRRMRKTSVPERAAAIEPYERLLAALIDEHAGGPAGQRREIRIVSEAAGAPAVIASFTRAADA